MVVLRCGRYVKTVKPGGIHRAHPVGWKIIRIPTRDMTLDISTPTLPQRNGNPVQIIAAVVYRPTIQKIAETLLVRQQTLALTDANVWANRACTRQPGHGSNRLPMQQNVA